jgi:acetyltransferase-like isoleucine patch superfamily enzyme
MAVTIQGDLSANDVRVSEKFLREGNGTIILTGTDATIVIEEPLAAGGIYSTVGSRAVLRVGRDCIFGQITLHAVVPDACIVIGQDVGFNGAVSIAAHEASKITVGDRSLFASGCHVNSSDVHQIYDADTNKRINPAADIAIGEDVWLGAGALIMKGARIGNMTVVAAGAIVTGSHPGSSIIAGAPARVIRSGIYWRR